MKTIFVDCNDELDAVFARVIRRDDPPITVNTSKVAPEALPALVAGYEVILDDHTYLATQLVAQCESLKHIVFLGTGASSYMDVPALAARGVTVHTIKGYGDRAVAEHAIALMFACARELARMDRSTRGGIWVPREGMQLLGKTLGVLGLGGIGQEVARLGAALGMQVIGWNRTSRPDAPCLLVALDDLLARADVISLHLALTDETRGMIDRTRIARMKEGAILVNTARGALVDEDALVEALRAGQIARAGLDVFHAEPLSPDHPLARLDTVTISSHAAFRTLEASMTLMRRAVDIVRRITGRPPAA